MKRILSLLMALTLLFVFVGCQDHKDPTPTPPTPSVKLQTPTNISVDEKALITWDAVEGAVGYIVTIDGEDDSSGKNYYQASANRSFNFTVTAIGKSNGQYFYSEESKQYSFTAKEMPVEPSDVSVKIVGGTDIKGAVGQTLQLSAAIRGEDAYDDLVEWSVIEGSDIVSVDEKGLVTVNADVTEEKKVTIKALSPTFEVYDTRTLTVGVKPTLTQEMLDALGGNKKINFSGVIDITSWTVGISQQIASQASTTLYTVMDGTHWYAEYTNSAGTKSGLYCAEHNGNASLVGLSYQNEETYEDVTDDDGNAVSWESAGYYNNFTGLKVSDFRLNDETWYFDYVGNDATLATRMIASANPYDFKVNTEEGKGFSLYVSDGEVSGLYAKSSVDFTVVSGYDSYQELKVAIFADDELEVPSVAKYSYDETVHAPLKAAIEKMQNLSSYKMNMCITMSSYGTVSQSFVEETITDNVSYFVPYTVSGSSDIAENRTYDYSSAYGYYKTGQATEGGALYNTFYFDNDGKVVANRAYDSAKTEVDSRPSFNFAAEIFRTYAPDEESGETTYYLADTMSAAARMFYNCVGNDYDMFGLFATTYSADDLTIIPSVTVKDGHIVSAQFYFNITIIYGVVELDFSEFDTATVGDLSFENYEVRQIPTSWSELVMQLSDEDDNDYEQNAKTYLDNKFGDASSVPFFGNALGDCYGFGMEYYYTPTGSKKGYNSVLFYYDVPLDDDYSITSSLEKIRAYLKEQGFTENKYGEFYKEKLCIAPLDNDLDLLIYVCQVD